MIQLFIIVPYLIAMLGVGFFSLRDAGKPDNYFVAGRRGTTLFVTGSLVATAVGASATLGVAGLGFKQGLTGSWWLLVGTVGLIVLGLFLARKVRDYAVYTLPQLMSKQYDRRVGMAASFLIVIAWVGITAAQILAAGKIMSVLGIGSSLFWMIVITIVTITYTVIGGQHSVIRTDTAQAFIIIGAILAGAAAVLTRVGGWSGLSAALPADRFSFPISQQYGPVNLISMLLLVGLTYVVGPDMYTRLFCARDYKVARASALWSGLLLVPIALAITLIGMGAAVLFPNIAAEQALPMVIKEIFSPWLSGLVMAALLAAVMSSADTTMLSAGTILAVDIFGWSDKNGERKLVPQARWVVAFIGLASLAVALVLNGIITAMLFAYTVYTAGLILPVLAGFFRERLKVTSAGALAALVGGGTTALISKFAAVKYLDLGALLISGLLLFSVSLIENRLRKRSGQKVLEKARGIDPE